VPFPDHSRLIAPGTQQLREGDLRAIKRKTIVQNPVYVAMLTGLYHRPAWSADGIGAERISEDHPLLRQPVYIGSLINYRAVSADGLQRVIIGKDKNNIGPSDSIRRLFVGAVSQKYRGNGQQQQFVHYVSFQNSEWM
jgi:hypothetical protein